MVRHRTPTTRCAQCKYGIYDYRPGCMGCGRPNPHFSAAAFEKEMGRPLIAALEECRSGEAHADAAKIVEEFPDSPFCEICHIDLRRIARARTKKAASS